MQNLVIDEGNSRVKCAVFEDENLISLKVFKHYNLDTIVAEFGQSNIDHCIISSTKHSCDFFATTLKAFRHCIFLDHHTPIPIINAYETPETLGKDRLAAAVGACALYPKSELMIIDMGTAITIDYISFDTFLGGTISPGLTSRIKSLHDYTGQLPLVDTKFSDDVYGKNTHQAIQQGVFNGILHEINGACDDFLHHNPKRKIIITGGDTLFFEKKLKNTIFVNSNLVLIGLNTILNKYAI